MRASVTLGVFLSHLALGPWVFAAPPSAAPPSAAPPSAAPPSDAPPSAAPPSDAAPSAAPPSKTPSKAPVYDNSSAQYRPPPTERRGGFAMGLTLSYGLGDYRGYPLEVEALNDPTQEQKTGLSMASNLSLWLGGSPRDWLTVGVGLSLMGATLNQEIGTTTGILFHVEGFPLYSWGGTFRNLGLGFDGGVGIGAIYAKDDKKFEDPLAESGGMSTLGFSVFWEPILFWKISMGPAVNYTYAFSQTMQVNQFVLGFRTALYSAQPKMKP